MYLGNARQLKSSRRTVGEGEWQRVAVKELKNMENLVYNDAFHKVQDSIAINQFAYNIVI